MMTLTLTVVALVVAVVMTDRVIRGRNAETTRYWQSGK